MTSLAHGDFHGLRVTQGYRCDYASSETHFFYLRVSSPPFFNLAHFQARSNISEPEENSQWAMSRLKEEPIAMKKDASGTAIMVFSVRSKEAVKGQHDFREGLQDFVQVRGRTACHYSPRRLKFLTANGGVLTDVLEPE